MAFGNLRPASPPLAPDEIARLLATSRLMSPGAPGGALPPTDVLNAQGSAGGGYPPAGVVGMDSPRMAAGGAAPDMQALLAPRTVPDQPVAVSSAPQSDTPPAQPATPTAKPHPKFFDHDGAWRQVLGFAGDALSGHPVFQQAMERKEDNARKDALLKIQMQREDRAERKPVYQSVPNVGLVAIDPTNNATTTLVNAKTSGQAYAESLGLNPADPDYMTAIANYALRSNGPDALSARADLQDDRQAGAIDAMKERLGLQQSLANHRESLLRSRPHAGRAERPPTPSTVIGGVLAKMASGQALSPSETTLYTNYNNRGRGGGHAAATGGPPANAPRYRNAAGHTIAWDGKAWVESK